VGDRPRSEDQSRIAQ